MKPAQRTRKPSEVFKSGTQPHEMMAEVKKKKRGKVNEKLKKRNQREKQEEQQMKEKVQPLEQQGKEHKKKSKSVLISKPKKKGK